MPGYPGEYSMRNLGWLCKKKQVKRKTKSVKTKNQLLFEHNGFTEIIDKISIAVCNQTFKYKWNTQELDLEINGELNLKFNFSRPFRINGQDWKLISAEHGFLAKKHFLKLKLISTTKQKIELGLV